MRPNAWLTIALVVGAALVAVILQLTGFFGTSLGSTILSAVLAALIAALVVALGLCAIAIVRAPALLHAAVAAERDDFARATNALMAETRLWGPLGRPGELKRLVISRLEEFPLRGGEREALFGAVQWTLQNPLGHLFTPHDALDIPAKARQSESATQRFHLPIAAYLPEYPLNPYILGDIESNEDIHTLTQVRGAILRLVDEVRRNEDYWTGRSDVKR